MAHFAQLDENNRVVCVHYIDNQYVTDENGNESESLGIAQCKQTVSDLDVKFVQTSRSRRYRRTFASIDSYYLEDEDVFTDPKNFNSWVLNRDTYEWEAPIPIPVVEDGQTFRWDEETVSWIISDVPPRKMSINDFRDKLTLTEKLLWDTPLSGTIDQTAIINTFKKGFPLLIDDEETSQMVDILVSTLVYTRERINELLGISSD